MKKIPALLLALFLGFLSFSPGLAYAHSAVAVDYSELLKRFQESLSRPDVSDQTMESSMDSTLMNADLSEPEVGIEPKDWRTFYGYLEYDQGKVYLRPSDAHGKLLSGYMDKDMKLPPLLSKKLTERFYQIIRDTGKKNMGQTPADKVRTLVSITGTMNVKTGSIGVDFIDTIKDVPVTLLFKVKKTDGKPAVVPEAPYETDHYYGYLQYVDGKIYLLETNMSGRVRLSSNLENGNKGPRLLGIDQYDEMISIVRQQLADNKSRLDGKKIRILTDIMGKKDKNGSIKVMSIMEIDRPFR